MVGSGLTHARELLRLAASPIAIFAGKDLTAIGVYQAANEADLRIPEDLSVVGFDDLPGAECATPALTTVRQPLRDMGAAAATSDRPRTGQHRPSAPLSARIRAERYTTVDAREHLRVTKPSIRSACRQKLPPMWTGRIRCGCRRCPASTRHCSSTATEARTTSGIC